ncbi:MAG: tail fiber domain-containing protein [Flavobacteriales bacterium]|nr:tail fiber domain-containing protein [Flavobacteriales bacterium]
MKKLFCILLYLSFSFHSYSQLVSEQLTRLYNVPSLVDLNAITNPLAGQLAYVVSENTTYQYNGIEWGNFCIPGTPSTIELVDLDGDTKVMVEDGFDMDEIRMYAKGNNVLNIDTNARLKINNPNNSILIGSNPNIMGERNVVVGSLAFQNNHEMEGGGFGSDCVALGYSALNDNKGSSNVAIGYRAMSYLKSTSNNCNANVAIGALSLLKISDGDSNIAVGFRALEDNRSGIGNVGVGVRSLLTNKYGDYNVAFGYESAVYVGDDINYNTAIGGRALAQITGNNNTAVGYNAQVANNSNSNQVRIGNTDISHAAVQIAWSTSSDLLWKEKVRDLPYGMNVISKLRPVDYVRKNSSDNSREVGLIAQELAQVLEDVGFDDQGFLTQTDQGYYEVRYNDFIPIAIKGIQQQQENIDKQQEEINQLSAALKILNEKIKLLEQ